MLSVILPSALDTLKVACFKRPIYMHGFLPWLDYVERYWRRKTNFRKSGGKSKQIKRKSSEEYRKQQLDHLKTEREKMKIDYLQYSKPGI